MDDLDDGGGGGSGAGLLRVAEPIVDMVWGLFPCSLVVKRPEDERDKGLGGCGVDTLETELLTGASHLVKSN